MKASSPRASDEEEERERKKIRSRREAEKERERTREKETGVTGWQDSPFARLCALMRAGATEALRILSRLLLPRWTQKC